MTRKDYVTIAAAIRATLADCSGLESHSEAIEKVARALARLLSKENPKFDRARFMRAAGIDEPVRYCADCAAGLPGPYGTPGVAMARTRAGVLLCSQCGTREAMREYEAGVQS